MESVSEGGRSWVLISLEVAFPVQIRMQQKDANTTRLQCPTQNTITQSTVVTPDLTGTNKYLLNRIKRYQGIRMEVTEGARNLCRRLGKNQFTALTQATGKSQPNREQRKVSEHAGTRQNVSTASLLMIADDLVGAV
jgi:hypothetical protein